jgi:hypothetical protein
MQETDILERNWRVAGLGHPLHRAMTFTQAGVVLGRGITLLAEFERNGRVSSGLAFDGEEARVLSLLTAAYGKPVAEGAIEKIRRAGGPLVRWRKSVSANPSRVPRLAEGR